ncbi:MAG: hypothetical protein ACXACY_18575, partial [Candidatus Hodarchaeales archaeon]
MSFEDIINGSLLGDMSLEKTSAISARICYGCKYKKFLIFLSNELNKFNIKATDIRYTKSGKTSIIKNAPNYFKLRSKSYSYLLNLYNKWYNENGKHVPKDLIINKTICFYWYIGDGCLSFSNPQTKYHKT